MIAEFEEHLQSLRQMYVKATVRQRFQVAHDRVANPACGSNRLCIVLSAIEGVARSILHDQLLAQGMASPDAYREIRYCSVIQLVNKIYSNRGTAAEDVFGQDLELLDYAMQYRNLLIHEAAFMRQGYSEQLIAACRRVFERLEQDFSWH